MWREEECREDRAEADETGRKEGVVLACCRSLGAARRASGRRRSTEPEFVGRLASNVADSASVPLRI